MLEQVRLILVLLLLLLSINMKELVEMKCQPRHRLLFFSSLWVNIWRIYFHGWSRTSGASYLCCFHVVRMPDSRFASLLTKNTCE